MLGQAAWQVVGWCRVRRSEVFPWYVFYLKGDKHLQRDRVMLRWVMAGGNDCIQPPNARLWNCNGWNYDRGAGFEPSSFLIVTRLLWFCLWGNLSILVPGVYQGAPRHPCVMWILKAYLINRFSIRWPQQSFGRAWKSRILFLLRLVSVRIALIGLCHALRPSSCLERFCFKRSGVYHWFWWWKTFLALKSCCLIRQSSNAKLEVRHEMFS